MTIEAELLQVRGKKELLLAEDVLDWAKAHPKSELHKHIDWNDRTAAHEFRIWQCRRLIALHIVAEDGERRMVSLTIDRSRTGGGYRAVADVMTDKALHAIMLEDALRELDRVRARYDRLRELKPLWREAARVRRRATARAKGKEGKRAAA